MNTKTLIAALFATAISASAFAQTTPQTTITTPGTNTPKIDARQANQEKRIAQGQASGALTDKEATRLQNRETRLTNAEAAAKADGTVTKKERTKLKHMENKDSRAIKRQKHDAQVKPVSSTTPPTP